MLGQLDKERALKHGGAYRIVSIDCDDADGRYRREPSHEIGAEKLYDRRWAVAVMERSLEQMRAGSKSASQLKVIDRLSPFLAGHEIDGHYGPMSEDLGMTPGALKKRLFDYRKKFGAIIRKEVAETLQDPDDVDEELRYLVEVLASTDLSGPHTPPPQ